MNSFDQPGNEFGPDSGNDHAPLLKQAKACMIGLSILVGAATLAAIFATSVPLYNACIVLLALCPLAGIVLVRTYPTLFTLFKGKANRLTDPRADLVAVIVWPGIGMLFPLKTGSYPIHLVDGFQLGYWVLLIFVCFAAALFNTALQSPSRFGTFFGLLIAGLLYSSGVIRAADTLPDLSPPIAFHTQVVQMHESHGRSTTYYLRLAPWGPIDRAADVDVPGRMYGRTKVGDEVCLGLHPGTLHAPWYSLAPCTD